MNNINLNINKLKNRKIVCLTLDLEQDFGELLETVSYEGLSQIDNLINLLDKRKLPLTCFVQGSLFTSHDKSISRFAEINTEFGLHAFSHPKPQNIDHESEIVKGKEAFINYFGKEPLAYRSPSGIISEKMFNLLSTHKFKYDSSVFLSFRPGGYFNGLGKPILPYFLDGCQTIEFPIAVFSKYLRVPITLSYVKLLGKPYFSLLKTCNLPNLIVFDFHLHDLKTLVSANNIPLNQYGFVYRSIFRRVYQRNDNSIQGLELLDCLISVFSAKGYEFLKLADVYELIAGERLS